MIYGAVRFDYLGERVTAELSERGWQIVPFVRFDPGVLEEAFNLLASPSDFGPADGDPMAAAIAKIAGLMGGTYELADIPSEAGAVY